MRTLTTVVGTALLAGTVACSQYTSATEPNTFRGCLQGDAANGFSLTAFSYANGTLTARSIRELEPTCAVRFAPDRDEPSK